MSDPNEELKRLTKQLQEMVGIPEGPQRDGIFGPNTARATIKKLSGFGVQIPGDEHIDPTPPATGDRVDSRSEENIATLHPVLQPIARQVIRRITESGKCFKITSGSRTYEQQAELRRKWEAGEGGKAARPGFSNHNFQLAFDVTEFKGPEKGALPIWESPNYKLIGILGKALGLTWGGDWIGKDQDEPHFSLRPPWAKLLSEEEMINELRRRHDKGIDQFA